MKRVIRKRNQLVEENLKYAERLALVFYHQRQNKGGVDLEELKSAAFVGLIDAASRFDESLGYAFRAFAYTRVIGAMCDYLRKHGAVGKMYQYLPEIKNLESSGEKVERPIARNVFELAEIVNTVDATNLEIHPSTMSEAVDVSYRNQADPEREICNKSIRSHLSKVIEKLPPRHREVIVKRYYYGLSFDEMSPDLGNASRSWLSRTHVQALDKLKDLLIEEAAQCRLREQEYAA